MGTLVWFPERKVKLNASSNSLMIALQKQEIRNTKYPTKQLSFFLNALHLDLKVTGTFRSDQGISIWKRRIINNCMEMLQLVHKHMIPGHWV